MYFASLITNAISLNMRLTQHFLLRLANGGGKCQGNNQQSKDDVERHIEAASEAIIEPQMLPILETEVNHTVVFRRAEAEATSLNQRTVICIVLPKLMPHRHQRKKNVTHSMVNSRPPICITSEIT